VIRANNIIKAIKEQRAFGSLGQPLCEWCGCYVATYGLNPDSSEYIQGETSIHDRLCTPCMMRSISMAQRRMEQNPLKPEKKKAPVCRYCWKKKKLVGAWCRTCRNNHQRRKIKEALGKLEKGELLTLEDEWLLAAAPHWTIWKREFRKVNLP
jgi:hypothetical protein